MKRVIRRPKRWLLACAILLAVYLLVGFIGAPLIIAYVVLPRLSDELHGRITAAWVWCNPFLLTATLDEVRVEDQQGEAIATVERLTIDVQAATLWRDGIVLKRLEVDRPGLHVVMDEGHRLNLLQLLPVSDGSAPATLPRVAVEWLAVIDGQASYEDLSLEHPFRHSARSLNFELNDFDTGSAEPGRYGFEASTPAGERFTLDGGVSLTPTRTSGRLILRDLDLKHYTPYYQSVFETVVNDGRLSFAADFELEPFSPQPILKASVREVSLSSLRAEGTSPIRARVELDGMIDRIDADVMGETLTIGVVQLSRGRFVFERLQQASARADEDGVPADVLRIESPGQWSARIEQISADDLVVGLVNDLIRDDADRADALVAVKSAAVEGLDAHVDPVTLRVASIGLDEPAARLVITESETVDMPDIRLHEIDLTAWLGGQPPQVDVESITITNAALDAADRSQEPDVRLQIDQANVTIEKLTSQPETYAQLTADARVQDSARAVVTARLIPIDFRQSTELSLTLSSFSLLPLDPYSERYLGHDLKSGTVQLKVHYNIANHQLSGEHEIDLDRFYLGDATNSPDRLQLPVKLGVDLLRDINEHINLHVPIKGDLSDPEFDFGAVIVRAVVNTVGKAALSPFAFIASSFGGSEDQDHSFVAFEPGSDRLGPLAEDKLAVLERAMTQRPQLTLSITGSYDPAADALALRRTILKDELAAERAEPLSHHDYRVAIQERFAAEPAATGPDARPKPQTTAPRQAPVRRSPIRERSPVRPPPRPEAPERIAVRSPASAEGRPSFAEQEAAALADIVLPETALPDLAARRAAAVRDALLQNEQLPQDRVRLATPATPPQDGPKVIFSLE